jgi:hypothetical protein
MTDDNRIISIWIRVKVGKIVATIQHIIFDGTVHYAKSLKRL